MLEAQDRLTHSDQNFADRELNRLHSEVSVALSSKPGISDNMEGDNNGDDADKGSTEGIFTARTGVSQVQLQHAQDIFNALPADMQKALVDAHVNVALMPGWHLGVGEGANLATIATVFTDSGAADQALVHELYEMAGQVSKITLKGSWNDAAAVEISDTDTTKIINGERANPHDLEDTISKFEFINGYQDNKTVNGDGDLMSNAFVADFFATHPSLYQDKRDSSILLTTIQSAPDLVDYIARAQGLTSATSSSSLPFSHS